MNSYRNKGERGCQIVSRLWPAFRRTMPGGAEDKRGIDGYLDGQSVQVKYDMRIAQSGNIYHEVYEKSADKPWEAWRKSPSLVDSYIFVTTDQAFRLSVDELAEMERDRPLIGISKTSMGFLIPISELPVKAVFPLGITV